MSRRRPRPSAITKAASPVGMLNSGAGTTYTADQVLALSRAMSNTGGQLATPLPRLDLPVPFGPGVPLNPAPINPVNPATGRPEPRAYEYAPTFNLPGFGDRLVPWKVLRDAADLIPLFRRCIEIRKAEVATLDWDVTISAKAVERAQRQDPTAARTDVEKAMRARVEPHIGRLVDFWEQPDPRNGHDFIAWACKLLEEYFVLDAIACYPRLRRGGDLYGFEILDGTTIKVLLDTDGFRPMPPNPAYQQVLYGFPRGEFIADTDPEGNLPGAYPSDRLVYKVHNVRSFTPYGYSAVEQALYDGELYIRRMNWLKAEYTDGVMPAGWLLAGAGQAEWSPQQLAEYNRALNDMLAGNSALRQRYQLLPYGMTPDQSRTDLGERYRPDYDLHLIKLVASHFDTTIAELGFTEQGGLGSTGWHEGQADVQDRKATQPTLRRLQALCTHLQRTFLGAPPELEFRILGLESEDEDSADEVAGRRVTQGRMTLNEDRDRTGLPRYAFPEADMPMVDTGRGVVFLEGASQLGAPGTMIGPPQAPPAAGQPGEQPPAEPVDGEETPAPGPTARGGSKLPDAVKAELVAYRRWLAKGHTTRPFRFETITKVQAQSAGVDLAKADFAEGVAGRAPKARHWPGWERDLAVAEHWAPVLLSASTGLASAEKLVREATRAYGRGGATAVARVLATLDFAAAFRPALHGMWTDGMVVGAISSRAALAHHGMIVKAEPGTITLGADWAGWVPGDEIAARHILEREGMITRLQQIVDTGDTIADKIAVNRLDRLAGTLIGGLKAGDAPAKIATALRAINDDPKWAHRVALTETTRAVSSATLERYTRNGVEAIEWMTALDQRVCGRCGINEDAGPIPMGYTFPDGSDAPPAHVLCRCSLAPAWMSPSELAAAGMGYSREDWESLGRTHPELMAGVAEEDDPEFLEQLRAFAAGGTQGLEDLLSGQGLELGEDVLAAADTEVATRTAEEILAEEQRVAALAQEVGLDPAVADELAARVAEWRDIPAARADEVAAEAADPALKMTVAELKRIALDNGVRITGATTKRDIIWRIRQWESDRLRSGGRKLIPDGPIGKPIRLGPEPIVAPPLGVPAADAKALSGAALDDWWDYFKYDRSQGRFEFVNAAGDTPAEGVRVSDLRVSIGDTAEGIDRYVVGTGTAWRFDDVAYLIEHGPDDFGAPWVSRTLQDLREAQATIPAAERANRAYAVLSRDNPADAYWQRTFGNPAHRAAASAGDGGISIWHFIPRASRIDVDVLRHETGHNLDSIIGRLAHGSESTSWLRAADADATHFAKIGDLRADRYRELAKVDPSRAFAKGVTQYGRSSAAEDYAESVMLYQVGPIATGVAPGETVARELWFRDIFPARAKLLDAQFPELARVQRAAVSEAKAAVLRVVPAAEQDLSRLTVPKLRDLAAERGITIPARALKKDILDLLRGGKPVETPLERMTVAQLRVEAKARGVVVRAGDKKPDLIARIQAGPPSEAETKAAVRQAEIDKVRKVADLAAEVHQLVGFGYDEARIRTELEAYARRTGTKVDKLLPHADNPQALLRAVDQAAKRAKLTRIGDVYSDVPARFDPKVHVTIGEPIRPGQAVDVLRPGFKATLANGDEVTLTKAQVDIAIEPSPGAILRTQPPTLDTLPRIDGKITPTEAAKTTNPRFGSTQDGPTYRAEGKAGQRWTPELGPLPWGAYEENCTNAVQAFEMRMRGFDVEAAPLDVLDKYGYVSGRTYSELDQSLADGWRNPDGTLHGRSFAGQAWRSFAEIDKEVAAQWPEGGRGFIFVGKHIFNVVKVGGKARYIEAQFDANATRNVTALYKRKYRAGSEFEGRLQEAKIVRVDDLVPSDAILDVVTRSGR